MAHLTIFSGTARSGKTTQSKKYREDPSYPDFKTIEGNNEKSSVDDVMHLLDAGHDVIYETNVEVKHLAKRLMERVDTIEIFRFDPDYKG